MDRLFETQKETLKATEKDEKQQNLPEKSEKTHLHLQTAEEKTLQFDEQTFSLKEEKEKKEEETFKDSKPAQNAYLQTFENKTVADIMREEAEKQSAELRILEKQKESLAEDALDPNMTIEAFQKSARENVKAESSQKAAKIENKAQQISQENLSSQEKDESTQENSSIIEKPNYDFLQEPKKTIKLSKKGEKTKKKHSSKTAGIVLACALAGSAAICVGNAVLIDQMSASFVQIDETYKFNLAKYLKSINNLNATKKSMDFLETYPDDLLQAGGLGEKSNWFDRLCNFLGGLFGG